MTPRTIATKTLTKVIQHGRSLSEALPTSDEQNAEDRDHKLMRELCFGTLRWYPRLEAIRSKLLSKPPRTKDTDIAILILVGLYQLLYLRIPDHAAISETVEACHELKKSWAKNLVNGTLRSFVRNKDQIFEQLETTPEFKYAHPAWLINMIKQSWPSEWENILQENNQHPPMTLRVNLSKTSRDDYVRALKEKNNDAKIIQSTKNRHYS